VGNLKTTTDANLHTTTYTYNLDDELTRVTYHDGTHGDTDYDAYGRVVTQTNPLGQVTLYSYDNLRSVVTTSRPGPTSTRLQTKYFYDPAGNLSAFQDEELKRIAYSYYENDALKVINYSNPSTPDVSFFYNSRGLRARMTDGTGSTGTTDYAYDSLDRLVSVQDSYKSTISYGYDAAGNNIATTYPVNTTSETKQISRAYDDANRLVTVRKFNARPTDDGFDFDYDPNGNLTSITFPQSFYHTAIDYNATNQVISMTTSDNINTLLHLAYTRDAKGLVSTAHEVVGTTGTTTYDHTYAYDTLDRLAGDLMTTITSTSNTISSTWTYDAGSRPTRSTSKPNGSGNTGDVVTTTRTYDAADQLRTLVEMTSTLTSTQTWTAKDVSYDYSSTGNRTIQTDTLGFPAPVITYTYDQANRLTAFDGGLDEFTYTYNGDGLRMSKRDTNNYTRPITFTWDIAGGLPLLIRAVEPVSASSSHVTKYIYGPGGMVLAQHDYPNLIPALPEQSPGQAGDPGKTSPQTLEEYSYLHADQLGNIRAATGELNQRQATWSYDAYGTRRCTTDLQNGECGGLAIHFGYAGQYTDDESGLQYLRARYYDPATQQFTSHDPKEASTGQPYVYAYGSPLNYTDPAGMEGNGLFQQELPSVGVRDVTGGGLEAGPPGITSYIGPARQLNGGIHWVDENAHMSERAEKYQSGATGARSNRVTRKSQAPALKYWINSKLRRVRFDGIETNVLIDRKLSITTFPKVFKAAVRQSAALTQNGYTGRWEVPNEREAGRADNMLSELGITNISVRVVEEP
jgi:RHS repeat-associated protein